MRRLPDVNFFVPDAVHERRRARRIEEALKECRDTLVLSHKNCLDGVGSYLIHALALGNHPPVVYTYPPDLPDVLGRIASEPAEGRTLSINDLSIDMRHLDQTVDALGRVKAAGWTVIWRDHHHKQWEGADIERLTELIDRFVLDRDQQECGTSLAQKDLLPDDPLGIALGDLVRDRDLWRNEDPRSEDHEFALRKLGTEQYVELFLETRDLDAPWVRTTAEQVRHETDLEVHTAIYATDLFGPRKEVALIYGDVPKNVTQHRIREVHGTRMEINMKPEGRFSVRSAPGTNVSHLLGQAYGGGGHPNAAGGKVPVPPWEWPAYWMKGGRSAAGMSVVRTALRLIKEADAEARP